MYKPYKDRPIELIRVSGESMRLLKNIKNAEGVPLRFLADKAIKLAYGKETALDDLLGKNRRPAKRKAK